MERNCDPQLDKLPKLGHTEVVGDNVSCSMYASVAGTDSLAKGKNRNKIYDEKFSNHIGSESDVRLITDENLDNDMRSGIQEFQNSVHNSSPLQLSDVPVSDYYECQLSNVDSEIHVSTNQKLDIGDQQLILQTNIETDELMIVRYGGYRKLNLNQQKTDCNGQICSTGNPKHTHVDRAYPKRYGSSVSLQKIHSSCFLSTAFIILVFLMLPSLTWSACTQTERELVIIMYGYHQERDIKLQLQDIAILDCCILGYNREIWILLVFNQSVSAEPEMEVLSKYVEEGNLPNYGKLFSTGSSSKEQKTCHQTNTTWEGNSSRNSYKHQKMHNVLNEYNNYKEDAVFGRTKLCIDMSQLKSYSPTLKGKTKSTRPRKRRQEHTSHDHTHSIFSISAPRLTVLSSCLTILAEDLLLSSTLWILVPVMVSVMLYCTFQLFALICKIMLIKEVIRKKICCIATTCTSVFKELRTVFYISGCIVAFLFFLITWIKFKDCFSVLNLLVSGTLYLLFLYFTVKINKAGVLYMITGFMDLLLMLIGVVILLVLSALTVLLFIKDTIKECRKQYDSSVPDVIKYINLFFSSIQDYIIVYRTFEEQKKIKDASALDLSYLMHNEKYLKTKLCPKKVHCSNTTGMDNEVDMKYKLSPEEDHCSYTTSITAMNKEGNTKNDLSPEGKCCSGKTGMDNGGYMENKLFPVGEFCSSRSKVMKVDVFKNGSANFTVVRGFRNVDIKTVNNSGVGNSLENMENVNSTNYRKDHRYIQMENNGTSDLKTKKIEKNIPVNVSNSVQPSDIYMNSNNDIHENTSLKSVVSSNNNSNFSEKNASVHKLKYEEEDEDEIEDELFGKTTNGNPVRNCKMTSDESLLLCSRTKDINVLIERGVGEEIPFEMSNYVETGKVWSDPGNCFVLDQDTDAYTLQKSFDDESNSLKSDSSNLSKYSISSSCSCECNAQVYNCQLGSYSDINLVKAVSKSPSLVKADSASLYSSCTVIDLQKKQESKFKRSVRMSVKKDDSLKKKPFNMKVTTRNNDISKLLKTTIEKMIKNEVCKRLNEVKSGKYQRKQSKMSRKRISRKRLRRIIYPIGNIVNIQIEGRPVLGFIQTSQNGSSTNQPQSNRPTEIETDIANNATAVGLSRPQLATSLPTSSNSLTSYFSKVMVGHEITFEEKMQYEMLRVQSFQDLPASCQVSPLRLAKTGFFSNGINDEVTCFSCGVRYKGWQLRDNPSELHRRISPECSMVNGGDPRNIPVSPQGNGIVQYSAHQESLPNVTNGFIQSTVHQDGDISTQTSGRSQNRPLTNEEIQNANVPDHTPAPRLQQPAAVQQHTLVPIDRAHSVLEGEQPRPAQRDMAEDLGITLDRPKYPAYAQLNVRISTYQGWPGYLDQTPRDMALAGFFYAGYNDYCRCFFCGGGLRNWDAGDDPWVEHARWFPKCAFVRQNRGHRFVEIIVKRQAEMQASGATGSSKNQTAVTTQSEMSSQRETSLQPTTTQSPPQSAAANSNVDPAIQSVKEIGYSDEIIQRAIGIIRQNNPGKERIEATEILEIIFTIADDDTPQTNTAVASDNTPMSLLSQSQPSQGQAVSQLTSKPAHRQEKKQNQLSSTSQTTQEMSLPSLSVSSLEQASASGTKTEQAGAKKEISENEIRSLQEENIQLKEQVMCKICMDKNVSIAFLPCGHLACCIDCAPAMRKCPMCRVYIKGTVKTYLA